MAIGLSHLVNTLDDYLKVKDIKDYCPNGLQIEGRSKVHTLVTGVTACQALIDKAIELNADAILVHHGYFWKNEPSSLVGMKQRRIKALLNNDISLLTYHLPLDMHEVVGNNIQLAKQLGIQLEGLLAPDNPNVIGLQGNLAQPMTVDEFAGVVVRQLGRVPQIVDCGKPICKVAWSTGAGQGFIDAAIAAGADLYLTGEASEKMYHYAIENDISFMAAGHHATERYGVKALGDYIASTLDIEHIFVDIDNPF